VVNDLFGYDPDTGVIYSHRPIKGFLAKPKSGYLTVTIEGHRFNISRVCWLLATQQDPGDYEVDHINRDPKDNKLENLRLATRSQQLANRNRTSPVPLPKGVTYCASRNSYTASWGKNGRKHTASGFATLEEAHLYYLWNTRHHGEFADDLPISACPPPPSARKHRRRRGTNDLPKGVSRVLRRRKNGEIYHAGFQTSYVNKDGKYVTKKGFKTPDEAHNYYIKHKK
jgi:hypothetical protein